MGNKITLILLLLPLFCFSQNGARKILHGQVVSDSLQVDNVTVQNRTAKTTSITDEDGSFTIHARSTDTLIFKSVIFREAKFIIKETHFTVEKIVVKLDTDVTVLDEIIVTNLTGNLAVDSRRTKIKNFTPAVDSGKIIRQMDSELKMTEGADIPPTPMPHESSLQGIDFKKIYKLVFKPKPGKKTAEAYVNNTPFPTVIKERFAEYFFVETLKIPLAEIDHFITFCDRGATSSELLDPKREFELIDYFITKSREYLTKGK